MISFDELKSRALDLTQSGVAKAKELTDVAKLNIANSTEEDNIRKAYIELGKLYYRDYAVGEEQDSAEYLPWCQKIDESKQTIAALQDQIAQLRAQECACDAPAESECCCDKPADDAQSCCCGKPEGEAEKPCCCDKSAEDSVEIKLESGDAPEA